MANLIDAHFQIHKRSPFSLAATKTLLQHLLSALDHVHSNYIIHRDVKLTNLLYTNTGILKLADFGLSRPYATSAHDDDGDGMLLTPDGTFPLAIFVRDCRLLPECTMFLTQFVL